MMSNTHPVTLYGFLLALFTLGAMVALTVNGNVAADVSVPIIVAIGAGGIGAGAGIAHPQQGNSEDTGTVGIAEPDTSA